MLNETTAHTSIEVKSKPSLLPVSEVVGDVALTGATADMQENVGQEILVLDLSPGSTPLGGSLELELDDNALIKLPVPNDPDSEILIPEGKALDARRFGEVTAGQWRAQTAGLKSLMEEPGFKFLPEGVTEDHDAPVAVPTPETFKSLMAQKGIEVELVPAGSLEGSKYLEAYKRNVYPVATNERFYYAHDAGPDHVPAIIFGGSILRDALSRAATTALETKDEKTIKLAAKRLDIFTDRLTDYIVYTSGELSDGEKLSRAAVNDILQMGQMLGLSSDEINSIINTVASSSREYVSKEPRLVGLPQGNEPVIEPPSVVGIEI